MIISSLNSFCCSADGTLCTSPDAFSEKHESKIWCHCRDVSKVGSLSTQFVGVLLFSAQNLASNCKTISLIHPCNGIISYSRASHLNLTAASPSDQIQSTPRHNTHIRDREGLVR